MKTESVPGSCTKFVLSSTSSVVYKVIKDNKYIRIRNNMTEQTIKITCKYYIMIDIHYIIRFKLLDVTHR
jgi:hypothetical protein